MVDEACGDRSPQAHQANMFDLDMKFADVESITDVLVDLKEKFGADSCKSHVE